MKKLIVLILIVLCCVPASAQAQRYNENDRYFRPNSYGPALYYGLRLGLNLSSISSEDVELDADCLAGLYFGGVLGVQLAPHSPIWFETGLGYSEKGGVARLETGKMKYRMSYLQMPLAVKFNFDVREFRIQPYLGGYLAVGVAGKVKNYNIHDSSQSSFDIFNRFDGGIRFGCGAEYQMIYLELGFDLGLANINKDDFYSTHNRCFYINAGVNF